jgi:hypothetical protein
MNDDVLANIAAFSDIDTRWSMGIPTRPLKRNSGFDKKLAAIHLRTDVRFDTDTWYPKHGYWQIRLNDKMIIDIKQFQYNGRVPFVYNIVVSSSSGYYICDMKDGLTQHTYVD